MKPLPKVPRLEKSIQAAIIKKLKLNGWTLVKKFPGSRFLKGIPDLYVAKPGHPGQWIEVKKPKGSKWTPAQLKVFPQFLAAGVEIWVVVSEEQVPEILGQAGNCVLTDSGFLGKIPVS